MTNQFLQPYKSLMLAEVEYRCLTTCSSFFKPLYSIIHDYSGFGFWFIAGGDVETSLNFIFVCKEVGSTYRNKK